LTAKVADDGVMLLGRIHGVIARRVLLKFRIDPQVIGKLLPAPFRPKLYKGYAVGGVCMIRFRELRPQFVPAWLGMASENAAHRIAVEWDEAGERREGVFIPQRNTASRFNKALGGRAFPGVFSLSQFEAVESAESVAVRITDGDGVEQVRFAADVCDAHGRDSIFPTIDEAANFFSMGATGYSTARDGKNFEGMELRSLSWRVSPMWMREAYSRWFMREDYFPAGSVEFDCALLMRDIAHEWHSRPRILGR
jgi:hypothetical protein